jgi:hypothetical protein
MFQRKESLSLAAELFEIIEIRKMYEKREKELKDHFKVIMKNNDVSILRVENILMIVSERTTTVIDREKLVDVMGLENAKRMEKIVPYQILEVKKVA